MCIVFFVNFRCGVGDRRREGNNPGRYKQKRTRLRTAAIYEYYVEEATKN